jgi:hypothetical protein
MRAETEAAKSLSYRDWLQSEIDHESYWFHQIELTPDLTTPGWSNPAKEKLPYFGLPERMDDMRVLDIGCAEGFFHLKQNAAELRKSWPLTLTRVQFDGSISVAGP